MNMKRIALGPIGMLLDALHQHAQIHDGMPPRRIEIHSAVFAELKAQPDILKFLTFTAEEYFFCDVPIIIDKLAVRPKIITCKNEVEYL